MALASKDTLSAVRKLGQAESMLPPGGMGGLGPSDQRGPIIWFALGTAYVAAGQDADARTRFERVAASEYLRLYRPIEFVRSFYYLGQIAERQGDAARRASTTRDLPGTGRTAISTARRWKRRSARATARRTQTTASPRSPTRGNGSRSAPRRANLASRRLHALNSLPTACRRPLHC